MTILGEQIINIISGKAVKLCLLFYYATNVWTSFELTVHAVSKCMSFPIDSRMQWGDWTAEQQFGLCSWSPLLTEGFQFSLAFVPGVMTADLWSTVQPRVSGQILFISVTDLSPCGNDVSSSTCSSVLYLNWLLFICVCVRVFVCVCACLCGLRIHMCIMTWV